MHIFLVNDDGIGSEGILALYRAALERGHQVSMCAPLRQQSAASHRITLRDPLRVQLYELEGARGFAIDGTPADCVRVGLSALVDQPVDVVISGMNEGYNAGIAVHYSGTVGAAMEASFYRLPAIATSIHYKATPEMIDHLATFTICMAEQYVRVPPLPCTILNINAPCVAPADLAQPVYAPLDTGYFQDGYEQRAPGEYWLEGGEHREKPVPGSDMDLLTKGHITLTLVGNFGSAPKALWDSLSL